jgi:hypothetical protein
VPSISYVRDLNGNPTTITRDDKVSTFEYDPINQLIAANVVYGSGDGTSTYNQVLDYDGRVTARRSLEDGRTTTYTVDDANELLRRQAQAGESVRRFPSPKENVLAKAYDLKARFAMNDRVVQPVSLPRPTPTVVPTPPSGWYRFLGSLFPQPDAVYAAVPQNDGGVNRTSLVADVRNDALAITSTQRRQAPCLDLMTNEGVVREGLGFFNLKIVNRGSTPIDVSRLDLSARLWLRGDTLHVIWAKDIGAAVYDAVGKRIGEFNLMRYGRNTTGWMEREVHANGGLANQKGDIPIVFAGGIAVIAPGGCIKGM